MKILITGANGLVGKDLVKYLSKNHKIFALFRNNNKDLYKNKNVKWIKHDLKNKINLNVKPDYIINCVATHLFSKKRDFVDFYDSHILSIFNIAEFANKKKIKKIINLSSITTYGKVKQSKLTEKEIPNNPDVLGMTKFIGEKILKKMFPNSINLRLPGILCLNNATDRPLVCRILTSLKDNQKIIAYNKNAPFNNIIDTLEIARILEKIFISKSFLKGTFNLSANNPIKLCKLIDFMKINSSSKSKIYYKLTKNKSFMISSSKIEKKLGFVPISALTIIKRNLF
mgnify:CR=1 FL=1